VGLKFVSYAYSSKDVPGKWSLVLFLPYCNLRCRDCHNWKLAAGKEEATVTEEKVLREVKENPLVDCVVISGGEPTVHSLPALTSFIKKLKETNPSLLLRIDTNGTNPEALKALKELVDGFAVDLKAPPGNPSLYAYTAGKKVDTERIRESVEVADGMPLTIFRTPRYPWLTEEDLSALEEFTSSLNSPWHVNQFFPVPDCPFSREDSLP